LGVLALSFPAKADASQPAAEEVVVVVQSSEAEVVAPSLEAVVLPSVVEAESLWVAEVAPSVAVAAGASLAAFAFRVPSAFAFAFPLPLSIALARPGQDQGGPPRPCRRWRKEQERKQL
jgi:hypothetical protein